MDLNTRDTYENASSRREARNKKNPIAIEQRFSECDEMNDYWSNPCDAIELHL